MAFRARIAAAIHGDLDQFMKDEIRITEKAVTNGVTEAALGLQQQLRGQVMRAGLGRRVANAWRKKTYPESGEPSMSAAAEVFTKAPHIVRAFDEGALIKGKSGLWLAIPTDAAPKKGVGGRRIDPTSFPEHRYGKLRFVYRRNGPSLLVVDGVRINKSGKTGRRAKNPFLKSGAFRKGIVTVVMFTLVRQVHLRKRLDVGRAEARWSARLPKIIVSEMNRLDKARRS